MEMVCAKRTVEDSPTQQTWRFVDIKISWKHFLGLHDLKSSAVWRASLIEMVFMGFFVFGSIIISMGSHMHFSSPTVGSAFFHFLMLGIFVRASNPPSDAQINPTVTLCAVLSGLYTPAKGLLYILAQSFGSIVGALCAKTLLPVEEVHRKHLAGCVFRNSTAGLNSHQAFISEFIFSLILVYMNIMVPVDPKQFQLMGLQFAPFYIGMIAALCIYVSGSIAPGYGGAFMNPARCIGPAAAFGGAELLDNLWIFLFAPVLAAVVAAALYRGIPPDHRRSASESNVDDQYRGKGKSFGYGDEEAGLALSADSGSKQVQHHEA
ncbi:protein MpXIP [Marchantia polymorpha subsp. ruderalis]|uniref:Aquaporin n=2 Tax=Marchantia polymorpha TaxID=3197 RepID=A0AAF6B0Q3_MARPO|nr:hypothetical protein MARPO_0004s0233 [Marchantia polymorpha]BBN05587.1 hypothetical protein Mp_3g14380 [Marchantia polymorpha subsp. ruderalis]|eukprot:PTQ48995.1 hypothetical protein MARPO_0004s0233 [Marchantia polymorpha]